MSSDDAVGVRRIVGEQDRTGPAHAFADAGMVRELVRDGGEAAHQSLALLEIIPPLPTVGDEHHRRPGVPKARPELLGETLDTTRSGACEDRHQPFGIAPVKTDPIIVRLDLERIPFAFSPVRQRVCSSRPIADPRRLNWFSSPKLPPTVLEVAPASALWWAARCCRTLLPRARPQPSFYLRVR